MIKQSVKNYFKCLKYVFTPLGIIALGFVCGLSIAVPAIIDAVSDMCTRVMSIVGDAVDFELLFDNISASINALDWSDPAQALSTIFTKEWFNDTVVNNLVEIVGDVDVYIAQINVAISECVDTIILYAIVIAIFVVIAFIAGYFLTRRMIRGDIAKRSFKNFLIETAVGAVLWTACTSLCIWLAFLWKNSIYISVIVAFILACFVSLLNAYITYGRKKVPFKSVVNIKNIIKLIISNAIIFAIGIAITVLIALITNIIVGAFVAIGIIMVTVPVMELTSDSYVKALARDSEQPIDIPEQPKTEQTETEQTETATANNNGE